MRRRRWLPLYLFLLLAGAVPARAEMVMKILVVNPSESETKEFDIRNPLPPEVKPQHVVNADGLRVEYDSQAGTYLLLGTVTLKPKESVTKRIVLEDVWVIEAERLSALRREARSILDKLEDTTYVQQGRLMADAIERRLAAVEESQGEPFATPAQHITRYREDLKQLQAVESDLVSLRQLMVMAALQPDRPADTASPASDAGGPTVGEPGGGLSARSTWQLILVILGLLAFVSVSFFLVARRQLKMQLAKQAAQTAPPAEASTTILGASPPSSPPAP